MEKENYHVKAGWKIKIKGYMQRVLIAIIMVTWMFVGCETIRQVKVGCYGHWVNDGIQRGSRPLNRNAKKPYYQCVDENPPHNNKEAIRWP
jgi:hypothetical protein